MIHAIQMFCVVIFAYFISMWNAENRNISDIIVKVVVSSDNYSLNEVNMERNRYKYADERQIEFKENDWTQLTLRPLANKTNLRTVDAVSYTEDSDQFITETLTRCVGEVNSVEKTDNGYLVTFNNWYDNHYTGFIRYYLTEQNKCGKSTLNMKVFDKYNKEYAYQISKGGIAC